MTIVPKQVKYLSGDRVAKMVGLPLHEIRAMRKRREGPPFLGAEPYVTYRDKDVELWARVCMRAPEEWFMRFDHPTQTACGGPIFTASGIVNICRCVRRA